MGVNNGRTRRIVMPNVNGKTYPYTTKGKSAAEAARAKVKANNDRKQNAKKKKKK